MTNQEKTDKINNLLKAQDLYKCLNVDNVNHNPHPYTIGPKHIHYASDHHGGMLGKETLDKVSCAHPNCTTPYDQHISDNVAFLQLQRNGTNDEANVILRKLVKKLGEKFVDGFAFVETSEKCRTI